MPFRFLEHTADVQVECRAATFGGLLETAAHALYAVTLREVRTANDVDHSFEADAESREDLVIRWLQELVFLLETDHFVATEFETNVVGQDRLTARFRGYRCSRDERAEEVKSATYHGLDVREDKDGFVAKVIFDL